MKTFFRAFILSLIRPVYYKDILQARLKFSVKYYIVLSLLLVLISSVAGVLNYSLSVKNDLTESAEEMTQNFPHDLVLTIAPGGITANKEFPLVAQTPSALLRPNKTPQQSAETGLPKNLVVIDPKGEIDALEKYNSLMLINNSYVIVGNGNSVQTAPLKDFPETRIDYPKMQQLSQTLLFIAKYAGFFTAGFFALTGLFNFFVWRLIYLAVFALGLWLTYKSVTGSYSKAFQVSLHSITLPILINTTLGIAGVTIPFPGWFMIVHTIFTFYNLSRLEKNP
ncbi:MAG: DUF1189 family protein [Patescibacteria group bacterium]